MQTKSGRQVWEIHTGGLRAVMEVVGGVTPDLGHTGSVALPHESFAKMTELPCVIAWH